MAQSTANSIYSAPIQSRMDNTPAGQRAANFLGFSRTWVNYWTNIQTALDKLVSGASAGYVVDAIVTNAVTPDLSKGFTHEITLNQAAQITINNPANVPVAGSTIKFRVLQDVTGGRPAPLWGTNYTGLTNAAEIVEDASTYTVYQFTVIPSGKLALDFQSTGLS